MVSYLCLREYIREIIYSPDHTRDAHRSLYANARLRSGPQQTNGPFSGWRGIATAPTVISVLKTYRVADVAVPMAGLRERVQLVKYADVQSGRKQWF